MTHRERDEVELVVSKVGEERVGGELDAPRGGDGRGPRLDGGDGDIGPRAPEHVDGDDRLHRLRPIRDRDQHLREQPNQSTVRSPPPIRTQRSGARS